MGFSNGERTTTTFTTGTGDRRREISNAVASERALTSRSPRRGEKGKMAKRKGSSTSGPRTRSKAAKEAREVDNAQRLDKLPPEVWEKILDELDENDLFPLALSCRYFRQKQKELVERTKQQGPESEFPCRALRTNLKGKLLNCTPA